MGNTIKRSLDVSSLRDFLFSSILEAGIVRNMRYTRYFQERSKVAHLIKNGQQHQALLQVERAIWNLNIVHVLFMVENYCYLLMERVTLFKSQRSCPDELMEAVASLLFVALKCEELSSLQKIYKAFTKRFGRKLIASITELRSTCAVNLDVVKKLSTAQPRLECRLKMMREIASEIGYTLDIEDVFSSQIMEEKLKFDTSTELYWKYEINGLMKANMSKKISHSCNGMEKASFEKIYPTEEYESSLEDDYSTNLETSFGEEESDDERSSDDSDDDYFFYDCEDYNGVEG